MTSEGRRLHVAAVFVGVIDQLRGFALPIVVVALLGGHGGGESLARGAIYALIGIVLFSVRQGLYVATARWYVDAESVRLRTGILSESITAVPLERVQAVDTLHGPLQRLFGVVEVHIQTAGGGKKAEIILKAVTEQDAEEIREAVRERGVGARISDDEAAPQEPIWEIGTRDLVKAAATSGSLGVLVPFVAAATQFGNDAVSSKEAERLLPNTSLEALRDVALILFVAWLLSFMGTLVAFAGFRLTRDGARLRIRRGFFVHRDASIPIARVHAVRVIESPLREPFGLAAIRVDTAGYAKEPATAQTLIPLVRRSEAAAMIARVLPEFEGEIGGLEPLPRRAARRYALPLALPWVVLAVVLALVVGPLGLLAGLLALAGALLGVVRWRAAGFRVDGDRVVVRGRRFARSTAIARAHRFQHVDVSANPFQRRAQLATLMMALGSGRRIPLRHVGADTADDLFSSLGRRALGR